MVDQWEICCLDLGNDFIKFFTPKEAMHIDNIKEFVRRYKPQFTGNGKEWEDESIILLLSDSWEPYAVGDFWYKQFFRRKIQHDGMSIDSELQT
jgi:hypothetical protein